MVLTRCRCFQQVDKRQKRSFFKQKTAYEIRPRDWSSDVCSSDLIALLGTGCDLVSPSSTPRVYALYRIGDAVLPVPTTPPAPLPALLGDTLTIPATRGRTGQVVVSRVQVYKAETGGLSRSSTRHSAQAEGDLLIVDTCPLGAYSVAVEPL